MSTFLVVEFVFFFFLRVDQLLGQKVVVFLVKGLVDFDDFLYVFFCYTSAASSHDVKGMIFWWFELAFLIHVKVVFVACHGCEAYHIMVLSFTLKITSHYV